MDKSLPKQGHRPFKDLAALLKRRKIPLAPGQVDHPSQIKNPGPVSPESESELFLKAMADVKPMECKRIHQISKERHIDISTRSDDCRHTMTALRKLIDRGRGFMVSQTPEYMESAAPGVGAEILRRLHQGRFAIQDYVDLHGLRVPEAEHALTLFIKRAIGSGYSAVLVVHGRGLTSPREPVLKQKVFSWLTRGMLRKWVIALTSARSCDGGTGATYVLLRQRPMTKSQRRKAIAKSKASGSKGPGIGSPL